MANLRLALQDDLDDATDALGKAKRVYVADRRSLEEAQDELSRLRRTVQCGEAFLCPGAAKYLSVSVINKMKQARSELSSVELEVQHEQDRVRLSARDVERCRRAAASAKERFDAFRPALGNGPSRKKTARERGQEDRKWKAKRGEACKRQARENETWEREAGARRARDREAREEEANRDRRKTTTSPPAASPRIRHVIIDSYIQSSLPRPAFEYSVLSAFSEPPSGRSCKSPACMRGTSGGRVLKACSCDIAVVFGRLKGQELRKMRVAFHPDWFVRCAADKRASFQKMAQEVFVALG